MWTHPSHQRWQLQRLFSEMKELLSFDLVSHLPGELAEKIFTYLDASSLCTAAHCCRRWREMTNSDTFWWEKEGVAIALSLPETVFASSFFLAPHCQNTAQSNRIHDSVRPYMIEWLTGACFCGWFNLMQYSPQLLGMVKVQMSPPILALHLWLIALSLVPRVFQKG